MNGGYLITPPLPPNIEGRNNKNPHIRGENGITFCYPYSYPESMTERPVGRTPILGMLPESPKSPAIRDAQSRQTLPVRRVRKLSIPVWSRYLRSKPHQKIGPKSGPLCISYPLLAHASRGFSKPVSKVSYRRLRISSDIITSTSFYLFFQKKYSNMRIITK